MRERFTGALGRRRSSHDDHIHILTDIGRALRIASEESGLEDWDLRERLIAAGVEPHLAWRIVTFVPMAFARPELEDLGVKAPETYLIRDEHGRDTRRRLRDELVFRAAIEHIADFSERPGFREMTTRAAELNALSELMHRGSKPEDCVLTEALTWEPPD